MFVPNIRLQQPQGVRPVYAQQPFQIPPQGFVPGQMQGQLQGPDMASAALPSDWEQQLQEAYDTGYADGMQEAKDQCFDVNATNKPKKGMTFIESLTPKKLKILPGVKKPKSK